MSETPIEQLVRNLIGAVDADDLMPADRQCRMCGNYLVSGLPGWPKPLLPGDIPARREVCDECADKYGPFPDEPYSPPWAKEKDKDE